MWPAGDCTAADFKAGVRPGLLSRIKRACGDRAGRYRAVRRRAIHLVLAGLVHLHGVVRGLLLHRGGMGAARLHLRTEIAGHARHRSSGQHRPRHSQRDKKRHDGPRPTTLSVLCCQHVFHHPPDLINEAVSRDYVTSDIIPQAFAIRRNVTESGEFGAGPSHEGEGRKRRRVSAYRRRLWRDSADTSWLSSHPSVGYVSSIKS